MATELKQDGRRGILTTPLPKDGNSDPLALVRFDGSEGLSELFNFTVEAVSLNPNINFDQALGKACTVKIKTVGPDRVFNGILVAAQSLGPSQNEFFGYRLTLRPWLWLLTRTTDYRIFQDKKVPAIIKEVFKDRGFTDFESKIENEDSFPTLEYCVQYRETDFNFVSRLMEKEGIYYFFKHEDGKHTLVLANAKSSHQPVPSHPTTTFQVAAGARFTQTDEVLTDWTSSRQVRSGIFHLNDYFYEKPKTNMAAIEIGSESYTRSDMEIYDYPGNYKDPGVGSRYAQIALEAEQAQDHRRFGSGTAISLFPGGLTTLKSLGGSANVKKLQPPDAEFQEYLVVRALHSFGTQFYRTTNDTRQAAIYDGNFEFQPSNRPFRAPMVTPKPRIFGIQTAVVVDKQARGRVDSSPEEIEVEKLTEIYVSFYWDRRKHDEKRSCKLRCAQVWSGKKWGGQFIPRIGMEVVVEFLEGDPDRPLIVGCVYNDDNQPPYNLPSEKTKSGIKSDSTKGGHGFNEWNFEDKKGSEQINVHAEKDLNVDVLNNETRNIGNDLTTTITHAEKRTIGEQFLPPKGSPSRDITIQSGDDNLMITLGDQTISIPLGKQTTTALMSITNNVIASTITMSPASISLVSPEIDLTAAVVNITAPVINITGVINLTGALNITGGILVNGMVPVLIPA